MSNAQPALRPALILDRDGVVNEDVGYLYRIEECRFVDGIFALARAFSGRGFALVIATNQAGIGRGYYGEPEFERLMAWMKGEFARHGAPLDAVYHCPYHPTEAVGPYRRDSEFRKPRPGMLLRAATELGLDLERSWCIGDKMTDIEAGRAAGLRNLVLFDPAARELGWREDYAIVPRLDVVPALLAQALRQPPGQGFRVNASLTQAPDDGRLGPEVKA
jgi:D-glycero-D-manno-heptose 1,7-bisphosphate phosphatase